MGILDKLNKISGKVNNLLGPKKNVEPKIIEEETIVAGKKQDANTVKSEYIIEGGTGVVSDDERKKAIEQLEKDADDAK